MYNIVLVIIHKMDMDFLFPVVISIKP